MKRAAALIVLVLLVLSGASPAHAYTHFGASNNVSLSIQWSQAWFGTAATAIVVRSDSFADSLAAGALAGDSDAPVLMNPAGGGLDDRVANELARLSVDTVVVIGGTAAVSAQTFADLEGSGYDVRRVAGPNRLATAAAVRDDSFGDATTAYLARAFGNGSSAFADSLGAGMLAGSEGAPLLLTATESLSAETRDALSGVTRVVLVGGTAAVSDAVADEVRGMGITVERVAGVDRFETAARLADLSFDPARSRLIAVVDGRHANSWASGFAASAAAGGAVILSDGDTLPEPTASFLRSQAATATTDDLYCAPEVGHDACLAAEALLNG